MSDLLLYENQWLLYLKGARLVSDHTLSAYQQDLRQFRDLTVVDLRAWLADRHSKDFHKRSTMRSLSGVKSFIKFLRQTQVINNHSLLNLRSPRIQKTLPRPLSPLEVATMLKTIPTISDQDWLGQRDKSLFMLIYSAGLRISEALKLTYKDIRGGDYLLINGKGGKFRKVPYLSKVNQEITTYLRLCPFVFNEDTPLFLGAKGSKLAVGVAERQMQRYRQLAGLPDWATPHALRHSCASHLMQSSGNLRAIQELLGHASLSTTQIYTDIDQNYLMEAYNKTHPRA